MQIEFSNNARKEYKKLDLKLRKQAKKKFNFLLDDFRHKSLNVKKYDKKLDIWQGRINKSWRFYFYIINDLYFVFKIRNHPK